MTRHLQSGLSLIEALVSIVILSIGLLGATKMQLNLHVASQVARERVEAMAYARNKIELLRDAGSCSAGTEGPTTPYQGSTAYTLTVTCSSSTLPVVTVVWIDSRGGSNNVVLQTNL